MIAATRTFKQDSIRFNYAIGVPMVWFSRTIPTWGLKLDGAYYLWKQFPALNNDNWKATLNAWSNMGATIDNERFSVPNLNAMFYRFMGQSPVTSPAITGGIFATYMRDCIVEHTHTSYSRYQPGGLEVDDGGAVSVSENRAYSTYSGGPETAPDWVTVHIIVRCM
jgi:hypothetical protein